MYIHSLADITGAALPIGIAAGALLIGFAAGRFHISRRFRHEFLEAADTATLGVMLTPEEQAKYSVAYLDRDAARRQMNDITYSVPNVLTPFVVTGPKPGLSGNAFVNSAQFRSRNEVQMPKPPGVYRIFLTGGSTAFGSGAPSQETTPGAYLERVLNARAQPGETNRRYEVFTFANPAWTTTHERIAIENRLSELDADMVISLSGSNDAHWAAAGRNVFWFRTYTDQHCWNLLNLARRVAGVEPMPDVEEKSAGVSPAMVAERLEKNVRLCATAMDLKRSQYVFALQPMIAVSTKPLSAREAEIRGPDSGGARYFVESYSYIRSQLSSLAGEQLLYLDLSDIFARFTSADEIFLDSYHFGDRGNAVIAEAIADGISSALGETNRNLTVSSKPRPPQNSV